MRAGQEHRSPSLLLSKCATQTPNPRAVGHTLSNAKTGVEEAWGGGVSWAGGALEGAKAQGLSCVWLSVPRGSSLEPDEVDRGWSTHWSGHQGPGLVLASPTE